MNNKANIIISVTGLIAVVAVLVMVFLPGGDKSPEGVKYAKDDPNRPVAVLSIQKIDWGEINLNDTKESDLELKNDGKSPLVLKRMSTNCGCTSVKAVYPDGKETKEYSMHKSSEQVTVNPGSSIKLTVIYRPFTMPVEGTVLRQVFLESDDPINPKLTIDANAVVRK